MGRVRIPRQQGRFGRIAWTGAALVAALACYHTFLAGPVGAQQGADDLQKRVAALEAGQKAILKELQEIKALLQARPPSPAPAQPAGAAAQPRPPALPNFDLEIGGAPAKGRADARLVLVEFSDFQCPYCGRYTRDTLGQIEKDYIETGKVRYVFRHFPLERLHPLALRAAHASECAHAQGRFWEMHNRLFANQQALAEADLLKTAQDLGLNMGSFKSCLADQPAAPPKVRKDQAEGARAGISGTPTIFLGTMTKEGRVKVLRKLVGAQPYPNFKKAIDETLASLGAAGGTP